MENQQEKGRRGFKPVGRQGNSLSFPEIYRQYQHISVHADIDTDTDSFSVSVPKLHSPCAEVKPQ